jgi:hypothetical protein
VVSDCRRLRQDLVVVELPADAGIGAWCLRKVCCVQLRKSFAAYNISQQCSWVAAWPAVSLMLGA